MLVHGDAAAKTRPPAKGAAAPHHSSAPQCPGGSDYTESNVEADLVPESVPESVPDSVRASVAASVPDLVPESPALEILASVMESVSRDAQGGSNCKGQARHLP